MVSDGVHSAVHRFRRYLRDHVFVRLFALPIVLMGGLLLLLFLRAGALGVESLQVVAVYLVLSFVVVGVSLAGEKALTAARSG